MANKKINWEFDNKTETHFKVYLTFTTNESLFNYIFNKTTRKLKNKHGIEVKETGDIREFKVPKEHFKFVKIGIGSMEKKIYKEVKKDKIEVMESWIEDISFKKKGGEWDVKVILGGLYADKR